LSLHEEHLLYLPIFFYGTPFGRKRVVQADRQAGLAIIFILMASFMCHSIMQSGMHSMFPCGSGTWRFCASQMQIHGYIHTYSLLPCK
jgi:hypothetical protein